MTETSGSSAAAQQEHDILVEMLARRITIPTWVVATNVARQKPVPCPTSSSGFAYPDIVAHEKFTGRLAAVGEVETTTTLTEEQSEVWATSAHLAPRFFLYVPDELESTARTLLSRLRIRPTGLFLYRHTEKNTFVVRRAK